MRRAWALLFIVCLFGFSFNLFAQEEAAPGGVPEEAPDSPPAGSEDDSDWANFITSPYSAGDRNFVLSLGVLFPTYFGGGGIEDNQHGISLGGTGSLAMNYFLTPHIFVGGELAGMFAATRGGNMLYTIPFGARIGYQFLYRRFEFPVSLLVGGAVQKYLDKGYFGLFVKPGASVFWRFNNDWSFGFNSAWWFVPQWPRNGYDVFGNFIELTLSARYHF